ncbi:MAG: hypothetical protein H8D56_04595 [Planctomycetes bacterium]|nr:hypothetical protein [Planctomycetota bacterium]MBL7143822.1 hypothetical protein [Phycisphaerae bacterium]
MPGSLRKLLSQDIGRTSRSLIFFVLFCLYLRFVVDLRLIYNFTEVITNFPVFYKGRAFFCGFLSQPGGLVEYTGAFLSQLFYISWAGALVVTIQAWLMSACFGCILKAVNLSHLRLLRFIPPILLLITYTQYTYHFITTMAFLVTLLFVCLYLRITHSLMSNTGRLIVVLILSVILYTIAAGAYLLFAVLCAMYELLFRRQCLLGLLFLLSAVVIPYIEGVLIFGVSIINAYSDLSPLSWKILSFDNRRKLIVIIFILYSLVPLTILASGFWQIIRNSKIENRLNTLLTKIKFNISSPVLKWIIESLALFAIASTAVFFSYDKEKKTVFLTDFYASQRMWPQLLRAARCYPDNYFVVNAVNRALYHTGRLSYDMFSWPQNPHTLFLSTKKYEHASCKKSGIYLDIGLLNMAENALTESLEGLGERPSILKELALINMAKANYDSAQIYLGALSNTLFYDDCAKNYLEHLKSDPNLSEDKEIQRLRSVCMEKDYGFTSLHNIEASLLQLLEKNRQNRMAFEYLMSWYLLNGRLDKFVRNLERLDDFSVSQLPRLYEEAMLIYVFSVRKPVNLHGRQISAESRQRFEGFNQILNNYGKNKQAAYSKLAKDYRDSYFFYYVYGRQGTEQ